MMANVIFIVLEFLWIPRNEITGTRNLVGILNVACRNRVTQGSGGARL